MPIGPPRPSIFFAKIASVLIGLRADQRGTVAVMMGILAPVLIGAMGVGFEISNWYMQTRAMKNAADSAALAAAANAGSNYDVEAKAVTARYGYVDGSNNVTVTVLNSAPCPAGGNTCYSVTISGAVPLYFSKIVGFTGSTSEDSVKGISSTSVAQIASVQQPICLLALNKTGQAIRSDGGPKTNFTGCTVMSNAAAKCNGSNLQATYGLASSTNDGCGNKELSNVPNVLDPFSNLANNIPNNTCGGPNAYPQIPTKHNDPALPASNKLAGNISLNGNVQKCGDIQLTGNVVITTPDLSGATLVIQNGQLDLNGYTLSTANGSAVTIVFSGTAGSYTHAPTDSTTGGSGVLNIQAPTSGPWSGVALYQDPSLSTGVDLVYKGNNPAWDVTGLVYLPNASVTLSGAVNKSSNGAACMVMVADSVLINGTGSFYDQSPAGCNQAGVRMPTVTIPARAKLVY